MSKRKKNEKNVIKLIRKSNELVEARYKFDIWETRVFTKMLTMVRKDDKDFQNYRIYLRDVIRDFQLDNNNDAYDRLRGGAMKLMSKIVKVVRNTEEGMKELNTPIVVGVENLIDRKNAKVEDAKFIDVSFHPGMKPFILSLQSHFTTYDVRNILKLPSSYSIRIYELLKQYQKIGRRKFGVEELKEIIGVIEEIDINGKKKLKDNYPLYGNFRQRVLEKAKKDLVKYTDIRFEYDPIKKGRAVRELMFHIFPNDPTHQTPIQKQSKKKAVVEIVRADPAIVNEIFEAVKEWVSLGVVRSWVEKYPVEQIKSAVNYTLTQLKNGKEIKNVGGYLQKMVREENLVNPLLAKNKQAAERKQKAAEKLKRKEELETLQRQFREEWRTKENSIIEALFLEQPDLQSELFEELKKSRFSGYQSSKTFEENMDDAMFSAAHRNLIKKKFEGRFAALGKFYQPKIKSIKGALNLL